MALAYEILLMRLFSIVQYHHFAYMVISIALLGYGASGTFLAFFRQYLLHRYSTSLVVNIILMGITAVACFFGGQHLLFNPDEIFWNNRYLFSLFSLYLLLALPFFFAANCIALTFLNFRQRISEVYAADLAGAGLGSVFIIGMLFALLPQKLLLLLGSMILAVAAVAWLELCLRPRWPALLFLGSAALFFLVPSDWTQLAISPYKGLSNQMRITGSRIIEEKSSPLALLSVVENDLVPFRYAPGLSLAAVFEPPEQVGVFMDGDSMSVISRFPEVRSQLGYFDMFTSSLPYHLKSAPHVLLLGAGTGSDILQAIYFNVARITAIELNPQVVTLVRERAVFSGNLYNRPDVHLHISEARSFVSGSSEYFDIIQIPFLDSFSSSATGLYALNENYLYTVEAIQEYVRHLASSGFLCMSRWVKLPPRDALKLFATSVQALRGMGIHNPGDYLAMIRGWQSASMLVKSSPLTPADIQILRKFCRERLFDLVYYPGMKETEANRFNMLQQPYFHDGVVSLLADDAQQYIERYKFNIQPTTDDRPYFSNFFKWRTLPEILKMRGQGSMALLESGYLILVLTLFQAIAASLALVLLPVIARPFKLTRLRTWNRSRVVMYFFAIGLAFLFLEIAFIQKFILYLGHPLYAAAAVLAIFLVFAGMGSQFSQAKCFHVAWPATVLLIVGALDLVSANFLFTYLIQLPGTVKIIVAVIMLGPLAFCMGIPFPLALTGVGASAPDLIPWVWAVNGCASVIAAVLATILAIHFGFTAVVVIALVLYGLAAVIFPQKQN